MNLLSSFYVACCDCLHYRLSKGLETQMIAEKVNFVWGVLGETTELIKKGRHNFPLIVFVIKNL